MNSLEQRDHLVGAFHEDRLGHLQRQRRRGQARVVRARDIDEIRQQRPHLVRRDVDGHREDVADRRVRLPAHSRTARLVERPLTDLADEAGLLGKRDEVAGGDEAARPVPPAQQRLDAHHATRGEVHERLVVQLELASTYGPTQVALGRHALEEVVVHVRLEADERQAAVALGAVHREVRVAQQQICVLVTLVVDGDPDARADEQLTATDPELAVQDALHAVRDPDRLAVDLVADDEHTELVAAEPGHHVAGRTAFRRRCATSAEQLVADRVARRVVDALEAVEVEEQHGDGADRGRSSGAGTAPARPARRKSGPVGEAGERVGVGLTGQLLLEAPALGDVPGGQHEAAYVRLVRAVR